MRATVIDRATNRRTKRVEQWAVTFPGGWTAVRREDATTSWDVVKDGHDGCLTHLPSVERIAELIESGAALAELDRQVADNARPRCTWRGSFASRCAEFAVNGSTRCDNPRHGEAS